MQHRSFWAVRHENNLLLGCNGKRARNKLQKNFSRTLNIYEKQELRSKSRTW